MAVLRIVGRLTLLSLLAVTAGWAARRASVEELRDLIGDAAAKHRSDTDTARRIAEFELTERITEDTLAALQSRAPGPETAATLAELADQSAFLEPPAVERSQGIAPTAAEQRQIFDRATDYTVDYAKRLPNLICTETIRRFDDALNPNPRTEELGDLHRRDTIVAQITYSKGKEIASIRTVNGAPQTNPAALKGVITTGEFGSIIIAVFYPGSHAKASWSHWEILHGKRVAVFRYTVLTANSQYELSYCCEGKKTRSIIAGYRGFLFLEPETGAIVRITRTSMDIPAAFPTRQVDTEVEYGPVTLGGQSFLCPIRSVTKADNLVLGNTLVSNGRFHSLNEIQFASYRKFEAEGRLIAADENAPAATAEQLPAPAAPKVPTGPEPAPELLAQGQDAVPSSSAGLDSVLNLPQLPPYREPARAEENVPFTGPTFREQVRVVRVPVTVKNRKGEAVSALSQEAFELFDNGKRQAITSFTVQRSAADAPGVKREAVSGRAASEVPDKVSSAMPDRFVAYVFDDVHLSFGDLSQTRSAGERLLRELLEPGTRIAIFTTSARTTLDFTADREQIAAALKKIRQNPVAGRRMDCPEVGYYQADLIVNKDNRDALASAIERAISQCGVNEQDKITARNMALQAARHSLAIHDYEVRATLETLRVIVRRLAVLPGERGMVLVSPGFFMSADLPGMDAVEDRAVRGGIVINTLDARGLYTLSGFDAEEQSAPDDYARQEQRQQADVLVRLADATGGRVFENSNDYDAGFRTLAKRPDVVYLLGFSPNDEKADGHYHRLKVKVKAGKGLEVQARRGYIASQKEVDPAQEAKEEIESALYARDEVRQIPMAVKMDLGQNDGTNTQIHVSTHVDIGQVGLQRVSERFQAKLTLVFGFFDGDGKMLVALVQDFPLNLSMNDLASRLKAGVDLRSDLKTSASSRFVRVVLRDGQGRMSTMNESLSR